MNTPAIIEGTPARTFTPNLINLEKAPPSEYSARYIPPPTPTGMAIIEAMVVIINVPINAGLIPPASKLSPGYTISSMLANQFGEADGSQVSSLFYAAFVLMILSLVLNIFAQWLVKKFSLKY